MRYNIIVKSRRVVCPICAGTAVVNEPMTLDCRDCHTHFRAVGLADFDAELWYEAESKGVSADA